MPCAALVARGIVFTILEPGLVIFLVPSWIDPGASWRAGYPLAGWPLIAAGVLIYLCCLGEFLFAGGTPAIFFSRPLRFLVGEEPEGIVGRGFYRFSRNPMYVGVLLAVFGLALASGSVRILIYSCGLSAFFHAIVVLVEEPHLRAARGPGYEDYLHTVPRWLGLPKR
jgi:protein-S-isoprenylcysteine O-methyltransferase Ste14